MKICTACKISKTEESYYKNQSRPDGLQNYCKECNSTKVKKHYRENPEYYKQKSGIRNRRLREEHQIKICQYLLEHPCVDCGESDIIVLDFDHVIGIKEENIAKMLGNYSWDKILEEMAKCEVRCANCHRRKTASRAQQYKFIHHSRLQVKSPSC